jgi:long-chain acyl-CoA synthetase
VCISVPAESVRPKLAYPVFKDEFERKMEGALKKVNSQVADYERLKMIVVMTKPWSMENGLLTRP